MNAKTKYRGIPPRLYDISDLKNTSIAPTWAKKKIIPIPTCHIGRWSFLSWNLSTFLKLLLTFSEISSVKGNNIINITGILKISTFIQEYGVGLYKAVIEQDITNANSKFWIHLFKFCINNHPSLFRLIE